MRQPLVPVEVDLQAERTPGGHADKDQDQVFVQEAEVVREALPVVRTQKGLARLLVVPGPIGATALKGGEDADQTVVRAPLPPPGAHAVFFTEVHFAEVLDAQPVLAGQALGVGLQLVP